MDQLDLSVFSQNYSIIALVDQDPGSATIRGRFERNCTELGIRVHRLQRYSIENYFSIRALGEVFGSQIDESIVEIDADAKLEEQIGINVKKNNRRLAQAMSLDEIGILTCTSSSEQLEKRAWPARRV